MNASKTFRRCTTLVLALALVWCTSEGPSTTENDPTAGQPKPTFIWTLDGDGNALAPEGDPADAALAFSGSQAFDDEALALDGVTGSGVTTGRGLVDTTASFSVAAWVSLAPTERARAAVSLLGEQVGAFTLGSDGDQAWFFARMEDGHVPGAGAYGAVPNIDADTWTHLLGVYDDDAHEIRLYVDGKRSATEPFDALWEATGPIAIGRSMSDGWPSEFWPGAIADVRIYRAALDDTSARDAATLGRPTAPPPPVPPVPAGFHCPEGYGACLGPLAPGWYMSRVFQPQVGLTLPRGWENLEDVLGNVLVQTRRDHHPISIGIYRNVRAPLKCEEAADPAVGGSVADLAEWFRSNPALDTKARFVSVDGLHGVEIDVAMDPSWNGTCPWFPDPVVPILFGGGPSQFHHAIWAGIEERVYLLRYRRSNIAIELFPAGEPGATYPTLPEILTEVHPIIVSLRFSR